MGLAVIPVGLADQYHEPRGIWAVMGPLLGWSFVGVGLYAALRPPSRRFGRGPLALPSAPNHRNPRPPV